MTHEEIEGAVIGALLLRNLDAYPQTFDVFSTLPVEAFGTRQYRDIYREIMRQALSKNVIDPVLVGELTQSSWSRNWKPFYASLVAKCDIEESYAESEFQKITR